MVRDCFGNASSLTFLSSGTLSSTFTYVLIVRAERIASTWLTNFEYVRDVLQTNSEFLGTVYSRKSIAESWNDYFAKRNCDTVYVVISKSKYSYFAGDMVSLPSCSTVLGVFKYSRENVDLNSTKQVIVYEQLLLE